jgi:hypothetical protein
MINSRWPRDGQLWRNSTKLRSHETATNATPLPGGQPLKRVRFVLNRMGRRGSCSMASSWTESMSAM